MQRQRTECINSKFEGRKKVAKAFIASNHKSKAYSRGEMERGRVKKQ